jgi:putative NIF3 family GTP cyclohydrolase 1 type 2
MKLSVCADYVKTVFGLSHVKLFGNPEDLAVRAAVLPGSGASGIPDAIRMDADVLITGDISHHEGIDAVMQGLSVIDAGHYGIEKIFVDYMQAFFREKMPDLTVFTEELEVPFRVI